MSENTWLKKTYQNAKEVVDRGLDKKIRIAVTGLSRAGKTAFITSFINQLLCVKENPNLPFFSLFKRGDFIGSKFQSYEDLHIPQFKYDEAMTRITTDPVSWPPSTSSVTQSRLSIRYKVNNRWLKKIQDTSLLTIDIVDYPGEWLLDLPLLQMTYSQWVAQCDSWINKVPRKGLAKEFIEQLSEIQSNDKVSQQKIADIAESYKKFLQRCKDSEQNMSLIQPGRFILPGELLGAPVLDFFPLLIRTAAQDGVYQVLEERFNYYRDFIVRPFFKEYFAKVDRQIVLVDCLSTLNAGYESYKDMQFTLSQLLEGFNYGQSNWIKRIFNPTIDKLMIVATKSDHVPPEQHRNLEAFLQSMLQQTRNAIGYEGIELETMAISSINVTEPVIAEHDNKKLMCVRGREKKSGDMIVNYPGKIPDSPITKEQWNTMEFNFVEFDINGIDTEILPHIRMDKVIEFLLGDKFS